MRAVCWRHPPVVNGQVDFLDDAEDLPGSQVLSPHARWARRSGTGIARTGPGADQQPQEPFPLQGCHPPCKGNCKRSYIGPASSFDLNHKLKLIT